MQMGHTCIGGYDNLKNIHFISYWAAKRLGSFKNNSDDKKTFFFKQTLNETFKTEGTLPCKTKKH